MHKMKISDLSQAMRDAAEKLNEGPIVFAYLDEGAIRCETRDGEDPFVWHKDKWVRMVDGRF